MATFGRERRQGVPIRLRASATACVCGTCRATRELQDYSARTASIGWISEARRAGRYAAIHATVSRITRPLQAEARVAWHAGTHVAKLSDWKQKKRLAERRWNLRSRSSGVRRCGSGDALQQRDHVAGHVSLRLLRLTFETGEAQIADELPHRLRWVTTAGREPGVAGRVPSTVVRIQVDETSLDEEVTHLEHITPSARV